MTQGRPAAAGGATAPDAARAAHALRTAVLRRAIAEGDPPAGPPFPCPYLAERQARHVVVVPRPLGPGVYHALMDLNFRRLGEIFYRPDCGGCRECRMIRIPVADFRPSRAQRRCSARNRDVSVEVGPARPSDEKRRLYAAYIRGRHDDGQMDGSVEELESFLYTSSVDTVEIVYRASGRLLAVSIADVEPLAMSAVYCYFDPAAAERSPGVFNVLWMIEECRRRGLDDLYLGYFVRGCRKMSYKAAYRPFEVLEPDGRWVAGGESR
jgi:arginine-tRNA-protein transferase